MSNDPVVDKETASASSAPAENSLSYMDDLEYHQVADWLEVGYEQRKDPKTAEKLSFLYDWAKENSGSEDRINRLEAIRSIQKTLGIHHAGPDTIKKIYMYVRLDQQRKKIEQEMKTMGNVDTTTLK